ncbi:MAG: uroporphyrinogen-III C-methyltransferase [Oscillospiraceae bacterium]|jgi:uroporphyrinogen III methyltransferase/synthase|nr:uroporphyrinogen-III C-methyltransferase [Oscillospiraceae bacterium]
MSDIGKVILVGAGPGDAGLLTLKGFDALKRADAVVYDRLVSEEILELIPERAERIFVGKESGNHTVPQNEINRILLREAQAGKLVVRLKGGDPFVFGRGGEELELLAENGVPFEVVPGVTSAFAVPAYAGIPVTHRDYCGSAHIITAHAKAGREVDIDFDALTRLNGTLVFLMGASAIANIAGGLVIAGMNPETPAAVVEHGTRYNQRKTLSTVAELAERGKFESPALLIVGDVCRLSGDFDWFGKLPLKGRRVVVTRSKDNVGKLSGMLRELGAEVIPYPCIETEVLRSELPELSNYDWLVFTSPQGVNSFGELLDASGRDARALALLKIAAVGASTANALKAIGLKADYVPENYNSTALAEGLTELGAKRILHLGAESGSDEFETFPVYRTNLVNSGELDLNGVDCVCFTSASTVKGFTSAVSDYRELRAACIGKLTAAEAAKHGFKVGVAENAALEELCKCVINLITED